MGLHSEAKQLRHDVFLNAGRDKYRCEAYCQNACKYCDSYV